MKKALSLVVPVLILGGFVWLCHELPGWIIGVGQEPVPVRDLTEPATAPRAEAPAVPALSQDKPLAPVMDAGEARALLKGVKDPEISLNIIDLGLVRNVDVQGRQVRVTLILTKRFCPFQGSISRAVREAITAAEPKVSVDVTIDYSRTWTFADLTEEGKKQWAALFGGDQ